MYTTTTTTTTPSIKTSTPATAVVVTPTPVIVPTGTVIVRQPFIFSTDYFENQGTSSTDLLTVNLPSSENIHWSVDLRPPRTENINVGASLKQPHLPSTSAILRQLFFQYTQNNTVVKLSSGLRHSLLLQQSNLYLPGFDLDLTLTTRDISLESPLAILGTKLKPLGVSSTIQYDHNKGVATGWIALYHAIQSTRDGSKFGIGLKGDFDGSVAKAAQFLLSYNKSTFEAVTSLSINNLRSKPSVINASLYDRLNFYGRSVEVTGKVEHNLDLERTTASVAVSDILTNTKLRVNSNGLVGVAATQTFVAGSVQLNVGVDFDTRNDNCLGAFKIIVH